MLGCAGSMRGRVDSQVDVCCLCWAVWVLFLAVWGFKRTVQSYQGARSVSAGVHHMIHRKVPGIFPGNETGFFCSRVPVYSTGFEYWGIFTSVHAPVSISKAFCPSLCCGLLSQGWDRDDVVLQLQRRCKGHMKCQL